MNCKWQPQNNPVNYVSRAFKISRISLPLVASFDMYFSLRYMPFYMTLAEFLFSSPSLHPPSNPEKFQESSTWEWRLNRLRRYLSGRQAPGCVGPGENWKWDGSEVWIHTNFSSHWFVASWPAHIWKESKVQMSRTEWNLYLASRLWSSSSMQGTSQLARATRERSSTGLWKLITRKLLLNPWHSGLTEVCYSQMFLVLENPIRSGSFKLQNLKFASHTGWALGGPHIRNTNIIRVHLNFKNLVIVGHYFLPT